MKNDQLIFELLNYAKSFIGVHYSWGGETPMGGFDCSGFVQECLKSVGYTFDRDHSSGMMYEHFASCGETTVCEAGALAFYGSPTRIKHVALCLNSFQVIEAAGGGSKTRSKDDAISHQAFVRIRHFGHRKDWVQSFMPKWSF